MELRAGYKETEVGDLPEGWDCVSVWELAERKANAIVGGPFGSDLVSADYVPIGVPVIRGQNMSGLSVSGDFVFVSVGKAKTLKANTAVPGDLIFTQRGTLGQVCRVPSAPFSLYVVSQSQMKLSATAEKYDSDFLLQYFHSQPGQQIILDSAIQTGVPHTNLGILKSYKLPAPPLPEQSAIAAALSDADALIASLDALIAKKRDLKQAAMQQLLTGKTRLPGFSGEWEVKRLGDYVRFLKNGTLSRAQLSSDGLVKYLHYGDIHGAAGLRLNPRSTEMPTASLDVVKALDRLEDGDVIFVDASEDLDGVGKSIEITGANGIDIVAGLHTIAARFDKRVLADGFKAYLQFVPAFCDYLRSMAAGTKVLATNRKHIAGVEMALPSTAEQAAITEVLFDMDAELAALVAQVAKARTLKQGMMQELLTGRIRLV